MENYIEINQTVKYNDITLKARKIPLYDCTGCYFDNKDDVRCEITRCRSVERKDGKNIILVEVK